LTNKRKVQNTRKELLL